MTRASWASTLRVLGGRMRVAGIDVGTHGIGVGFAGDCAPTALYLPNKHGRGPAALDALANELRDLVGPVDWLVIERMQIDGRTGAAEANALLDLQWIGGLIQGRVVAENVILPAAGEWSEGVPKPVRIERMLRDLAVELDVEDARAEVLIMPPRYSLTGGRTGDALDGLALARWQVARLTGARMRRVLSKVSL